eukprot:4022128-Prymnesium_polylepis.2
MAVRLAAWAAPARLQTVSSLSQVGGGRSMGPPFWRRDQCTTLSRLCRLSLLCCLTPTAHSHSHPTYSTPHGPTQDSA